MAIFYARRKEITNSVGTDLYSLEVFGPTFFETFKPEAEFEKWAAVEVTDWNSVPAEPETLLIQQGLYAVFVHKGPASDAKRTYDYFFSNWLPKSDYLLDDRPHFAIMGDKYKHEQEDSEEEVWIPVKPRT